MTKTLLLAFLMLTNLPVVLAAQDSIQALLRQRGVTITSAEILTRLRESGLTREQVRQRLRQAGYDPNLADRYFDELVRPDSVQPDRAVTRITQPLPRPTGNLLQALTSIGLLPPGSTAGDTAELRPVRRPTRDSLLLRDPQVFGKELFLATTTEFQPVLSGPVDPEYRLGPGDEMTLIVTGDVELGYTLEVTQAGYVVIPEVGQVHVAGLTLEAAKRLMNTRLARVYSGIRTGATDFDLGVGRLRRNRITIIGEVDIPGSYLVSGGATVFNALYLAGGPNANGSFRVIQVRRDNQIVRQVDLYDYLLRGDKSGDIRLEQGDVIFVPIVLRQAIVTGNVKRPAIFELKPGESLSDVLTFAGGVEAEAAVERIQIDRILPASERTPGVERTIVDVPLQQLRAGPVPLNDGDRIIVFGITTERRNRVSVSGDVHVPGMYEYRPGMNALQLIERAQGLLGTAYTAAAHIIRRNPADSTLRMVRISLDDPSASNYAARVPLTDLDEVVVFGQARLINPDSVEIFGLIKREGTYPFAQGMSVQDLVLQAGGFKEGALSTQAEVARRRSRADLRADSLAQVFRVPLSLPVAGDSTRPRVEEFELAPGDQVFIRRLPGFLPLQTIEVLGEVVFPGNYAVESDEERISRVIRRAGGVTDQANARGFQLIRDGKLVGVDLPAALARPNGPSDLIIRAGDRLVVPLYDPLVLVTGAVAFESLVRYEEGLGVEEYLSRAGGTLPEADEGRISVRFANGELRTTRSFLSVKRYPRVEPGSVITVPVETDKQGTNWDQILTRSLTLVSTLATLLLAARALDQ